MTAVPLASSSEAADCELETAADQVPSVAVSSAVSSLFALTPMPPPPWGRPATVEVASVAAAAAIPVEPASVGPPSAHAGRSPPPPGPPVIPLLLPALGMLPVCATDAVATAYALVPARPVSSAATIPAVAA